MSFTHLKWSCKETLKSKASPRSVKPMPMKALRPGKKIGILRSVLMANSTQWKHKLFYLKSRNVNHFPPDQRSTKYIDRALVQMLPQLAFVSKVLLEHRHTNLFTYGCFYTTTAELSSCNKRATSNIYYLSLYRKSLPTSDIDYGEKIMVAPDMGDLR